MQPAFCTCGACRKEKKCLHPGLLAVDAVQKGTQTGAGSIANPFNSLEDKTGIIQAWHRSSMEGTSFVVAKCLRPPMLAPSSLHS